MQPNPIRARWAAGQPIINGWLSIANPFSAEIMAAQGYDSVTVDLQHGLVGYEVATTMLQAMRASGVGQLVRVPWLDPAHVMKALDAGAHGVIAPMVNTPEDAARLVSYVKYPPHGERSFGPTRANISWGADYGEHADDQVLCFAMIETRQAMDNLSEIVKVPGLDGVYVGPADLTLGLTGQRYRRGFDREEPEMVEAIRHIVAQAHAAGIRAGLHTGGPDYALRALQWGYDLVTVSNDVRLLAGAASAQVGKLRAGLASGGAVADAGAANASAQQGGGY